MTADVEGKPKKNCKSKRRYGWWLVPCCLCTIVWFSPKFFVVDGRLDEVVVKMDSEEGFNYVRADIDNDAENLIGRWRLHNSSWHDWRPSVAAYRGGVSLRWSSGDHVRLHKERVIFNVNGSYQFTRSATEPDTRLMNELLRLLKQAR